MAYTDQQFAQLLQIIANSKLFSELSEQTVISDNSFFASINTGSEDAKKIKLPLLRGYSGDWNASTNTPTLVNGSGVSATVYRVGVASTRDLGSGAITYGVDEIIYYNGAKWVKLIQSQISDIVGLQVDLDEAVKLTGNQTIEGLKTFTSPIFSDSYVSATDFINISDANNPALNFIDTGEAETATINFNGITNEFSFNRDINTVNAITSSVTIKAGNFKLSALNTAPVSATAVGNIGEIRYTADYIYVCTAANTWKRTALTTWSY